MKAKNKELSYTTSKGVFVSVVLEGCVVTISSRGEYARIWESSLDDGTPVHSFQTLIAELTTVVRNTCRRRGGGEDEPVFMVATTPNAKQQRALDLVAAIRV